MIAALQRTVEASEWPEARTWMQAARALVIERHPYLDIALSAMLLVETPGHGTVSVDSRWRLYYDPQRVMDLVSAHGIGALTSDWVHEVMHLLRDHHRRWLSLQENPSLFNLFNIAADAIVNADVVDLGMEVGEGWVTFTALPPEAGCNRHMTTEEIFGRLRDLNPDRVTESGIASAQEHDCGSGSGGPQRPWERSLHGDLDDGSPDSDRRTELRDETGRQVARAGVAQNVPPRLRWWAERLIEPVIDWRRELAAIVSRHLSTLAGSRDYSYVRTSRRCVPGFVLPAMVAADPPTIAAVVDTSGSMDAGDITTCLGELLGLVRAAGGRALTVLQCDQEVTGVFTVRKSAQLESMSLHGGRGTDMSVAIEACTALKPTPEVIVVMTDGDTGWPEHKPLKLKNGRVIALLTRTGRLRVVPEWITTIVVDPSRRRESSPRNGRAPRAAGE